MPSTSASAPKKDRSTVPTVALLVACGISAHGFRAESEDLVWRAPAALVVASLIWAFWPSRSAADKTDSQL